MQAPVARSAARPTPLGLTSGQQRRLGALRGAGGAPSGSAAPSRHRMRRQQGPLAAAADADAAASLAADAAEAAAAAGAAAQQHAQQPDAAAAAAEGAAGEQPKKKGGSLAKRVVFGTILGLSGAAVIVTGGWLYGAVACLAAYQCSKVRGSVGAGGAGARGGAPPGCCQARPRPVAAGGGVSLAPCPRAGLPPGLPPEAASLKPPAPLSPPPPPQEYIGMVTAKGIAKGAAAPPPLVTTAISLLCVALNAWVFVTNGRAASAMAVASFLILSLSLVASPKPRFAQLASTIFGLLYCGAPRLLPPGGLVSKLGCRRQGPHAWRLWSAQRSCAPRCRGCQPTALLLLS